MTKIRVSKLLSFFLCFVMIATTFGQVPMIASAAESDSAQLTIQQGGKDVDNAELTKDDNAELTVAGAGDGDVQWQYYAAEYKMWINIYGETADKCVLTYAKVRNMLDDKDQTVIRCTQKDGDKTIKSNEVTVTVGEAVDKADSATSTYAVRRSAAKAAASNYNAASQANDTGENPATYNIVINYKFENNEIAADPYTANLAAGSSFSTTVTFPTVQGYLPYLNEVQKNSLDINYTAIDQNYTFNVVYKPTNVNYTVIHYQQNLNDDNYTEKERETKQGLTNSTVPDVAKKYDGFYALLYEKPAIAADGSTVVEVYYDRYYYLMNFDLDGGYGVEPIYARYGTPISDVGTPTKAGYTFEGWSLDGTKTVDLPKTMPAENRTYKAVWKANDTAKVTVVFWGENADDEEDSYIKSSEVYVKPGTSYSVNGDNDEYIHEHVTFCYDNVGSEVNNWKYSVNGEEIEGYIGEYGTTNWWESFTKVGNCIFIKGKWYVYEGKLQPGSIATCTCNKLDSNLWTFVESDTVTVAADGSSVVNVYYDRTEFTLQFRKSNSNFDDYGTIVAKWGKNIRTSFNEKSEAAGTALWATSRNGNSPWTSFLDVMPSEDRIYYAYSGSGTKQTATYYGESIDGTGWDVLYTSSAVYSGTLKITDEDKVPIKGFTYSEVTSNNNNFNGAKFYYTRNSYKLTFNDGYNVTNEESVKYEARLSSYSSYVPEAPSAYEPGSVEFAGWYLNPECTGERYDLTTHTMPADNVLLYAKWVPVTHNVEFYLDKSALDADTKLSTHPDITVPHGTIVTQAPADPTNGSYTFVGWFYMENGQEKAFDFANMPINKDLQVYGKWSSNVLKNYTIKYMIQDTATEIATPTTGSGLAGITKTFEAKGGSDLYTDYQEGYFPVAKSHSMTIDINATEENDTNVYTFWYVQKEAVPYTVKYLNKETGQPVADEKTVSDNRKAVVTETFVPVSGMMPDAYQKRLVVSADGNDNVIIFYYTEDTTHAYYKITHYTENLAKDAQGNTTWTEYASSQAVGDIGTTYTADSMTISGFTYDSSVSGTVTSGELTAKGLELKLYYTRNSYPYQVRYLEKGTGKQLKTPKNSAGKYGQIISETAAPIEGYTVEGDASQTMNIRIEVGTEANINIITFYYVENSVDINYVVVGPEESCGTVSPASETLKVFSGAPSGSTPSAEYGFKFVGWYTDATCKHAVDTELVDESNNKFIPAKVDNKNIAATYYAKFEYDLADITITKSGIQPVDHDGKDVYENKESQSVIFTITGPNNYSQRVVICGNESVTVKDLRVGEYTVTEKTDWSWRYTPGDNNYQTKAITSTGDNNFVFTNNRVLDKWLNGGAYSENVFTSISASE